MEANMNGHPTELLRPVFPWLDWVIAEHGVYIYLVFVWISPFLIAWILRGGFWRRHPTRYPVCVLPVLLIPTASPPPRQMPPPLPPTKDSHAESRPSSEDDAQSFGA